MRGEAAHFQRLTGMHKAMQPGGLRRQMVAHSTVALVPDDDRLKLGLQELENLRLLLSQLLLGAVVRNRQATGFQTMSIGVADDGVNSLARSYLNKAAKGWGIV